MQSIKKLAILTSGGDAPGMNSAVSAVVNCSILKGIEPYVIYEGFKGLLSKDIHKVSTQDVKKLISQGGTNIFSARFPEFKDVEVRKQGAKILQDMGIDALVVIGGDGSYMGAKGLTELGIATVGLPGTIDNDIALTDYTIGFFTALNTIVDQIGKLRDTTNSHNQCMVVEVMGRYCGALALSAAIATGAEVLSIPENKLSEDEILKQVKQARKDGNRSIIVVVTEHQYNVQDLAERIKNEADVDARATVLGYIQRGGAPVVQDIMLATRLSHFAVEKIVAGETGIAVGLINNKVVANSIMDVVNGPKDSYDELIKIYNNSK